MAENEDRLSKLPEDVLGHILSLVPTKSAVRTSVLSKCWRYTWNLVNNLDFEDIHPTHGTESFRDFVERVLQRCITQVKIFRLKVSRFYIPESIVSRWISEAVRLNVCELDVQVRHIELPLSLSVSMSLANLRLDFTQLYFPFLDSQSCISLPCVKTLDIVVAREASESVFKLIHGCPVLESLSLRIKWCNHVQDYYFNLPTLKRLKLSIGECTSVSNEVFLNVPNLEYLYVDGILSSHFVMEDLSTLFRAKVSCSLKSDYLWVELLRGINEVKSLSLTIKLWYAFNDLCVLPLPKFQNLKHLELKGNVGLRCQLIPQILESCPELEHFSIEKPRGGCWSTADIVPICMLLTLKTVIYAETRGHDLNKQFLKFMLENSKVMKMLILKCDTMFSEIEEEHLSAELKKFPRASKDCQIHFARS